MTSKERAERTLRRQIEAWKAEEVVRQDSSEAAAMLDVAAGRKKLGCYRSSNWDRGEVKGTCIHNVVFDSSEDNKSEENI